MHGEARILTQTLPVEAHRVSPSHDEGWMVEIQLSKATASQVAAPSPGRKCRLSGVPPACPSSSPHWAPPTAPFANTLEAPEPPPTRSK